MRDTNSLIGVAACGGLLSLIPLASAAASFSAWLHSRHKEKYEKYTLMVSRIEQAMKVARIAEEKISYLQ